jgi:hypothetical protein
MIMATPTNCCVCANEFDSNELQSIALSKINVTRFKICQSCLDQCDPSEDYKVARDIISSYLWLVNTKSLYKEASDILDDVSSTKKS